VTAVRVFVVVPAFREEMRIARVLRTMPACVEHIIVVDDASDDATFDIARDMATTEPRIVPLRHAHNRGVGAAIATGYRHALAMGGAPNDAFVVMAGDGQMDPRDLPALVSPIAEGLAGYVKGNRFAWPDAGSEFPYTRYVGGRVFSLATRIALATPIHDSQCGYTAMSRDACARLDLDALWPRFGYPNDLLSMLVRANITIAEVPVRPTYPHAHNKLGVRHLPVIAAIIGRAWVRRVVFRG
jgi:glycosyltransferase involved in cell wall biosynthesis